MILPVLNERLFLENLKDGKVDEAFAMTTNSFQNATPKEQFQNFVDRTPAIKTHTSRVMTGFNISVHTNTGKQATIKMTLNGPNSTTCTLIMVQENDEWRVQNFNVP